MKLVATLFWSFISLSAIAGGASTGGGGAFVCRNKETGAIISSELLDLWEGRNILGWDIPYSDAPVKEQIAKALFKLSHFDPVLHKKSLIEFEQIQLNAKYFATDVQIQAPQDAFPQYFKKGCPLEGMMLYDGNFDRLNIDKEIFSHLLNNTNIAASWVHETIYKILRDVMNHSDSRHARKLTACLFATNNCFATGEKIDFVIKAKYNCTNEDEDFLFVMQKDSKRHFIQSSRLGSIVFADPLFSKTDKVNQESFLINGLSNFGYASVRLSCYYDTIAMKLADGTILAELGACDYTFLASGEMYSLKSKSAICTPVQ